MPYISEADFLDDIRDYVGWSQDVDTHAHDDIIDYTYDTSVTGAGAVGAGEADDDKICLCGCVTSKVMMSVLRELSLLDKKNQEKVIRAVVNVINDRTDTLTSVEGNAEPLTFDDDAALSDDTGNITIGNGDDDDAIADIGNIKKEAYISTVPEVSGMDASSGETSSGETSSGETSSDEAPVSVMGKKEKTKRRKSNNAPVITDEPLEPVVPNPILSDKLYVPSTSPLTAAAHIAQSPLSDIKRGFALSNIFTPSDAFMDHENDVIALLPATKFK